MVKYKYERNTMTTIETLMDSLKNCRKAISQAVPFSRQDDLLKKIEANIMAEIRTAMNNTPRKKTR
jgi:hypothetical protein